MATVKFVGGVVSALCTLLIAGLTFAVPTNRSALHSFRWFIFWSCIIGFFGYCATFIADWRISCNERFLGQERERREAGRDKRYRRLLKTNEETLAFIKQLLPEGQEKSLVVRAADLGERTWSFLRQQHQAYQAQLDAQAALSEEERTRLFDAWGARMKSTFSTTLAPEIRAIVAEAHQRGIDTSDIERELDAHNQLPSYVEDVAIVFDELVINGIFDLYHAA